MFSERSLFFTSGKCYFFFAKLPEFLSADLDFCDTALVKDQFQKDIADRLSKLDLTSDNDKLMHEEDILLSEILNEDYSFVTRPKDSENQLVWADPQNYEEGFHRFTKRVLSTTVFQNKMSSMDK